MEAPSDTVKETLDAKFSENFGEKRLNQYVLHNILGTGSFGTVHLATDTDNARKVAIKEFSKLKLRKQQLQKSGNLFGGSRGRGRGRGGMMGGSTRPQEPSNPIDLIKEEIAILKKLHHKNIVKLYEVLDDPSQVNSVDKRTACLWYLSYATMAPLWEK
jgi:serine/threonine protein kinase